MEEHVLTAVLKTGDGRQVSLDEVLASRPAFVMGADARADLQVMGEGVAPSHAVITRSGADYSVAPRFPNTLVHLNGKPAKLPARLSVGDVIQLGSVQVTFTEVEGKPAQRGEVILPAVLPSGYVKPVSRPAASPAAPGPASLANRGTVYYPRQEQSGGGSAGALLSGLAVILIIGGVIGYSLFGAAAPSVAAGDLTAQFAYKDGNVTLVMFDADWWIYCKQQKPIVNGLAQQYRGDVYVEMVNIDDPGNRRLVSSYNVSATPTLIIFNDSGEVSAVFVGLTDASRLQPAIEQALSEAVGGAGR